MSNFGILYELGHVGDYFTTRCKYEHNICCLVYVLLTLLEVLLIIHTAERKLTLSSIS